MAVTSAYEGFVQVIRIEDEQRRNPLSGATVRGVLAALEEGRHKDARAVVITGSGAYFCAGADIRELRDGSWRHRPDPMDLFASVYDDPRLIFAALNGPAIGGGAELSLSCDFIVASTDAYLWCPEVALGVLPNTGMALLPRLVGGRAAAELVLLRRKLGAEEGRRLGVIASVVESGRAAATAVALADEQVRASAPRALAVAKRALRPPLDWHAIRHSLDALDPAEWEEGLASFLEKRRADFTRFWDARGRAPS